MNCELCPELVKSRKKICEGSLYFTTPIKFPEIMAIAEAPGVEEDRAGEPLIGASGQEARHHLTINGITGRGVVLDNINKCHPLGNRDPYSSEIANCTEAHLIPSILELQPKWVIAMGRISTQFFLGDVSVELVHGVPHTIDFHGLPLIIIPTYHPAAGLHSPEKMILFQGDMKVAGAVVRGDIEARPPVDLFKGKERYELIKTAHRCEQVLPRPERIERIIAVDTEWAQEKPWCVSFSEAPGEAWVIMADQHLSLSVLSAALGHRNTLTILQNALYDLPVLAEMGIVPAKVADTMVMAYLLQTEPQGLKQLAFRLVGMLMKSYSEMVAGATHKRALKYLKQVMEMEWPNPAPVLEWKKGEPHVRQPQNIRRKVGRIDLSRSTEDNLFDKWEKMSDIEGVVRVLGPLLESDLSEIPIRKAVRYSARDADATLRIYPILWEKIVEMGLEDTFWRDMRAMPMVVDMMANGMPVDLDAFEILGDYFQDRMDLIQRKMQATVGHHLDGKVVNPASYPQMSTLIYDRMELQKTGGKHKAKKGAAQKSTAESVLKRYVHLHPVVQDIMDWRGYQKLKTTYVNAIPKLVSPDGRVRTTLRMTRTATGRLSSSKPNLMAQPVRTEEGRKVRDCYVAGEGKLLASFDYSQIEMRVAANDAKDEKMMQIFWEGLDIHSQTASDMFGVPIDQVDEKKHRYPAKRVGFGILYMITAQGLQRELATQGLERSLDDCKEMIKSWFDIYQGIAAFMKASGVHAKRYGYVRDMWGRLRYIPGIKSTNKWVRMEAERQAGNAPVQMGAQGVIKEAMGRLVPFYREWSKELLPLIQIHDDIVWEMEEWMPAIVQPEIKKIMEGVAPKDFLVPLKVDFKTGRKWGSMK